MAKKKKAAEASTGSKGASSGARPSAASAATTARTKGAAVELSLASEERVRQLLTTLAVRTKGARPSLSLLYPYRPRVLDWARPAIVNRLAIAQLAGTSPERTQRMEDGTTSG
jgi:hypothetical protein